MYKDKLSFKKGGKADVLLGLQFGDEGKGKIVDTIAGGYDHVVRFQGGANSGHTVHYRDDTVVLRILPSSSLISSVKSYLGAGVVIDPIVLAKEIRTVKQYNKSFSLRMDERCHATMPAHISVDEVWDKTNHVGSTKRGNSPTYSSKLARVGVTFLSLVEAVSYNDEPISELNRLNSLSVEVFKAIEHSSFNKIDAPKLIELADCIQYITDNSIIMDVGKHLNERLGKGETVLLEGAQGCMLDVDYGTYPDISSSSVGTASAFLGSGVSPQYLGSVVGVIKPYTTRVGTGAFPSEVFDEIADRICRAGKEYGSVTGRKRRISLLFLPMLIDQIDRNGVTDIIITKMDIVDWSDYAFVNSKGIVENCDSSTKLISSLSRQFYGHGNGCRISAISNGVKREDIKPLTADTNSIMKISDYYDVEFKLTEVHSGFRLFVCDHVSLIIMNSGWKDEAYYIIEDAGFENSIIERLPVGHSSKFLHLS